MFYHMRASMVVEMSYDSGGLTRSDLGVQVHEENTGVGCYLPGGRDFGCHIQLHHERRSGPLTNPGAGGGDQRPEREVEQVH